MEKVDLKQELKELYTASAGTAKIVTVPAMNYLMLDGRGDPNDSPEFAAAVEALYSLAYTLKFTVKKGESAVDYGVMPLEGLWWTEDMAGFSIADKSNWQWTLMIMQPRFVTEELYQAALEQVRRKKELPALSSIRFTSMQDGLAAQIMHIGPFAAEGPTVANLHSFIRDQGYFLSGKHREIYLSDFRKTAPEKLKTIIRQPIGRIE